MSKNKELIQNPIFGKTGVGGLYFKEDVTVEDIIPVIEQRLSCIPRHIKFLCVTGLARTGTTAFQAVLSQLPSVAVCEFQPFKYMLRHGIGEADSFIYDAYNINGQPQTIVLKETLGPFKPMECTLDPVGILIRAGIQKERIQAIYIMRDPCKTYFSWSKFQNTIPKAVLMSQDTLISCYKKYVELLSACIPLCYEVFENEPLRVFQKLFSQLGLISGDYPLSLQLDEEVVNKKNRWNEGTVENYWNNVIQPVIEKGQFSYVKRPEPDISESDRQELTEKAMPTFNAWQKLTKEVLGL